MFGDPDWKNIRKEWEIRGEKSVSLFREEIELCVWLEPALHPFAIFWPIGQIITRRHMRRRKLEELLIYAR